MSWRVIHASVAGSGHEFARLPCQDANGFRILENGVLIAVVADGAGSARFPEQGSALAVAAAIKSLSRSLSDSPTIGEDQLSELLQNAADKAREALESEAALRSADASITPISIGDFATTLLMCVITDGYVAAFQVGDGGIVELARDGSVAALTNRESSEYVNETTFLTSQNYRAHASQFSKSRRETDSVALLTDGLQLLAITMSTNEPFAPFFLPLFQYAKTNNANSEELARFLRSERVCERTDDDKTLLIATPSTSR
jgi:serine/threonine protein phosphatase PrpC